MLLASAYAWPAAESLDLRALAGFTALDDPSILTAAHRISHAADPLPFALLSGALVLVALGRGRPRHAFAVLVFLIGANVTTQILKPLLAHPRAGEGLPSVVADAAFPSGHATAAMTLVFAAVLVAPPALRSLTAAAGAVFALAVSFSVVVLGWHFPSDVAGGHLVAAAWCFAVLAALRATAGREAEPARLFGRPERAAIAATALGVVTSLALLTAFAAPRLAEAVDYAQRHTSAVGVGGAVAACASVLLAAVTTVALGAPGAGDRPSGRRPPPPRT